MSNGGMDAPPSTDWLPAEASLIAVVRETGSGPWAAGIAVGLADIVGMQRGRTFLANAGIDGAELDAVLGVEGGAGLSSALTGAVSIASIARSSPDRSFTYLPAGDSAVPLSGLGRIPTFRRLVRKVTSGGGTLLLYVAAEDLAAASWDSVDVPAFDGCIALGSVRDLALELGAPLLARVERPAEPSGSPAASGIGQDGSDPGSPASASGSGPGGWNRRKVWIPALAMLLVAAWLVAVWRADAGESDELSAAAAAESLAGPVNSDSAPVEGQPVWAAPPANYSVLVGSYIRLRDAEERRSTLAADGGLFYVSPTPVRGRTYFRVFAGVYEDRVDAAAAMDLLVAEGRKEAVKAWDVRPVRLAHDLGTFDSLEAAEDRVQALREDSIPSYVLRDSTAASLFRVYAGAFESERAAVALSELLASRNIAVELEIRSGVAP